MTLIDGKAISEQVKQEIADEVAEIVANGGKRPFYLAAILVGHDGVQRNIRNCKSKKPVKYAVSNRPLSVMKAM